ncbi:MAG: hypothetical protein ACKO38_03780, partial [Planctomycetota bacterium]
MTLRLRTMKEKPFVEEIEEILAEARTLCAPRLAEEEDFEEESEDDDFDDDDEDDDLGDDED